MFVEMSLSLVHRLTSVCDLASQRPTVHYLAHPMEVFPGSVQGIGPVSPPPTDLSLGYQSNYQNVHSRSLRSLLW